MASKISPEVFADECSRWQRGAKTERLGQRLMNAFSVGETNPDIFYEKDHKKAAEMFSDKYVAAALN